MSVRRVYFATQCVAICPVGTLNPTVNDVLHGVQSVGTSTNFNLQNVQELGQLSVYEIKEDIPNVEVNVTKVFDGYSPAYLMATQGSASASLAGRSNAKCMVFLPVYDDINDNASGVPSARHDFSGLFVSSLNLQFPTDGFATESLTLVGNNKSIKTSGFSALTFFDGTDAPFSLGTSGGVQRRENVLFTPVSGSIEATADVNGVTTTQKVSVLPTQLPGITASGLNTLDSNGDFQCHVASIGVQVDLGRQELFELGRKGPYHRFVTFPIPVTTTISVTANTSDGIGATEVGGLNGAPLGSNLINQTIRVRLREGLMLDMGTKNKLQGVTYGGGDATGGNVVATYTYQNYNDLIVRHPNDPTTALRIPVV